LDIELSKLTYYAKTFCIVFLFSITLCSYSQQSLNNAASTLMQQHKMEIPVLTKNIMLSTSFNLYPEEIVNNNENINSIEPLTSFLSSANFIYILVLSLFGLILLYRLFRKN